MLQYRLSLAVGDANGVGPLACWGRDTVRGVAYGIAAMQVLALALQYRLSLAVGDANGVDPLASSVRYISYFTILINALAAAVLASPLLPAALSRRLGSPATRAATATYIAVVGIVYSLALRHIWDPQGLQLVVDRVLHDVAPVAYVLHWLIAVPKRAVSWTNIPAWLIYPLLYFAYCLVHGALAGWYPYPFVDAGALGYARVLVNAIGMTAGFLAVATLVVAVDRAWPTKRSALN